MNFSVTTSAALVLDLAKALRVGNLLIIAVALSVLASCAELPKRAPPPKTTVTTKQPVSVPVPVQTSTSGVDLVAPANHEQEKNRIKLQLSKNSRDSLPVADVGYYIDVLQGRLKQKIGKTKGIGIARSKDRIVIVMRGGSGFEAGNSQISPTIREFLSPLSKVLVEYRKTLVSVRVRADNSVQINPQLTEQRSQAVARYLMEAGISNKRMIVIGADKSKAGAANKVSGGQERIELQLEPVIGAKSSEP